MRMVRRGGRGLTRLSAPLPPRAADFNPLRARLLARACASSPRKRSYRSRKHERLSIYMCVCVWMCIYINTRVCGDEVGPAVA